MKLKNNLYEIIKRVPTEKGERFDILLHKEHAIYKAHFPTQPITPGVCIIQIAKELLEETFGSHLEIIHVKNVKFLSVLSPDEATIVSYELYNKKESNEDIRVQCLVTGNETNFAKISLRCRK